MKETILVGDIGSTKSTWWVSGQPPKEIRLIGFNPISQSVETGEKMFYALSGQLAGRTPDRVWYYGAGIIDGRVSQMIKDLLLQYFPGAYIIVDSDVRGAARALCGNSTGTVAILGTGSHAAIFDGKNITKQANALGYILGDEGGGCDIGKSLLQSFFYGRMPDNIKSAMVHLLPEGRTGFLNQLYVSPVPNQFLASFAQVATERKDDPWIKELVLERFRLFMKHILLPLVPTEPVHFLGSIGCIFADLIKNELEENALKAGIFLKDPAYRLFTMHDNHEIE